MGNVLSVCRSGKNSAVRAKKQEQAKKDGGVASALLSSQAIIEASSLDDWLVVRRLGRGAFGIVNLVVHKDRPDLRAALKRVPIYDIPQPEEAPYCSDPKNEWNEMQTLRHPHIVSGLRAWREKNHKRYDPAATTKVERDAAYFLHILLEYMPNGDLGHYIGNTDQIDDDTIGGIFVQLLSALWYMSQRNTCHRDLKPENILLTSRDGYLIAKVTDFGLARTLPQDVTSFLTACGTPPYMAPERLRKKNYDCRSDIWSLGLILVDMITKQHLFADHKGSLRELVEAQPHVALWLEQLLPYKASATFHKSLEEGKSLTDLILGMLAFSPDTRWTPEQCAQHPWVKYHMLRNGVELKMPPTSLDSATEMKDV